MRREVSCGIFGGITTVTEEIVRFSSREAAQTLVRDITISWVEDKDSFDLIRWNFPVKEEDGNESDNQ